jgi:hypothetical protein
MMTWLLLAEDPVVAALLSADAVLLFTLAFDALAVAWVYRDASKRGMNAVAWAAAVAALDVVGLAAYLAARRGRSAAAALEAEWVW